MSGPAVAGLIGLSCLVSFSAAALLTRHLTNPASRLYIPDIPNDRSLHDRPVPRGGGIAIVLGVVLGVSLVASALPLPEGMGSLAGGFVLVGLAAFADDRFSVPPGVRIVVHAGAAALLIAAGLHVQALLLPGVRWEWAAWLGVAAAFLYVVWMINLYNFMDGMDGFAAGMAAVGFSCCAVLGAVAGDAAFAAICLVIASSAAAFLCFNFPPARIFMGDVGSSVLGLAAAWVTLWADRGGLFPLWIGVLIFSPFIVDATFTLARRLLRGERVWRAHRSHYYQRLVSLGWGHRRTVLWEYVLMVFCAGSAVLATVLEPAAQWLLLGAWSAAYTILLIGVRRLEKAGHDG